MLMFSDKTGQESGVEEVEWISRGAGTLQFSGIFMFSDVTFSIPDDTASNGRMMNVWRNGANMEGKNLGLLWPNITGFVWKDIPTLHKYVMTKGVIVEIPSTSRTQIINVIDWA